MLNLHLSLEAGSAGKVRLSTFKNTNNHSIFNPSILVWSPSQSLFGTSRKTATAKETNFSSVFPVNALPRKTRKSL